MVERSSLEWGHSEKKCFQMKRFERFYNEGNGAIHPPKPRVPTGQRGRKRRKNSGVVLLVGWGERNGALP